MSKKIIILLFLLPMLTYGRRGRWANDISLYWGSTYRFNNDFYNSFDISYEKYYKGCIGSSYKGFGMRLDNFNNDNYSLSIKYFRSLVRRPVLLMIPYLGFSPVVFTMSKHIGLNIKPEIGLRFNSGAFSYRQPISVSLNLSYGYDIPITEEKEFTPGRHDLSAKIAITFNLHDIKYFFERNKKSTKDTLQ